MPELSIASFLQLVVGLGLLNVWMVRAGSSTDYRGGESTTLREEFKAYGLPDFVFYAVGALKIGSALVLVAGLWVSVPVKPAAGIIALLMVGALAMHVKGGAPPMLTLPAAAMLLMTAGIVLLP